MEGFPKIQTSSEPAHFHQQDFLVLKNCSILLDFLEFDNLHDRHNMRQYLVKIDPDQEAIP